MCPARYKLNYVKHPRPCRILWICSNRRTRLLTVTLQCGFSAAAQKRTFACIELSGNISILAIVEAKCQSKNYFTELF
jgi:hypothetical protein